MFTGTNMLSINDPIYFLLNTLKINTFLYDPNLNLEMQPIYF